MDYFDLLKDLADADDDVDPQSAKSIVNGAEEKLQDLKGQVQERFPEDVGGDSGGVKQKPKSEISRSERAEMYAQWREEGKDPNEEWDKLPE